MIDLRCLAILGAAIEQEVILVSRGIAQAWRSLNFEHTHISPRAKRGVHDQVEELLQRVLAGFFCFSPTRFHA